MRFSQIMLYFLVEFACRVYETWKNKSVFRKAASLFLMAGVGLLTVSTVELLIALFSGGLESLGMLQPQRDDSGKVYLSVMLCLISACFYVAAYFCDSTKKDKLVFEKTIMGPFVVQGANVNCYIGSITQVSGIDVIVTSEDTDLNLGSFSGTSVSGRVRRMAASYKNGILDKDNLSGWIQAWKLREGRCGDFKLGTCVATNEPFELKSKGVKAVIFAVAIRKTPDRVAIVEQESIQEIVDFAIKYCIDHHHQNVFLPVFGLGSGNAARNDAIDKTINAVRHSLGGGVKPLNIYIGVYRMFDAVRIVRKLRQCS